ncbi:ATP-binding protein [Thermodesulfovibrio hydrogeniphilus]
MSSEVLLNASDLIRCTIILFSFLSYWYFYHWKAKLYTNINKRAILFLFIGLTFSLFINMGFLFEHLLGKNFSLFISSFLVLFGIFIFYASIRATNKKFYYLMLIPLISSLCIVTEEDKYLFFNFIVLTAWYIHFYITKLKVRKLQETFSFIGGYKPFLIFGLHFLFLGLWLLLDLPIFNLIATIVVFLSIIMRINQFYEERYSQVFSYLIFFSLSVVFLYGLAEKSVEHLKNNEIFRKNLINEKFRDHFRERIDFYSNALKFVSSSETFKNSLKQGHEALCNWLTYVNETFATDIIFFVNSQGKITAVSHLYRNVILNRDVSSRKYFREAMEGKTSILIAKGIYIKKEDIRVAHPVYVDGKIAGVLVFQFSPSKKLVNFIKTENVFIMHKSGAVLIGPENIKNHFIFPPSKEDLDFIYKEKIFADEKLYLSNFKIKDDIFEDVDKNKWQLIKSEIIPDWYMASFVNLSFFDRYRSFFFLALLLIGFVSHNIAIMEFERIRKMFIQNTETLLLRNLTLDTIRRGVIHTDANGKIIYINKPAQELLEIDEQEVIGKEPEEIFNVTEHPEYSMYKLLKTNKKEIPVLYSYNEVIYKGLKQGQVITFRDASEEIKYLQMQQKLNRLEMLEKISASVTHDFNNSLMILTGNLSLLEKQETSESKKKLISRMLEATRMMAMTIEDFKAISPSYLRKKELININKLIERVANFVLSNTKINWQLKADKSYYVVGEEVQLFRVFQNLINNSREALNNEGEIKVEISEEKLNEKKYVLVKVQDNGPGIPEEFIEKIFEPYVSPKGEGRGLGLTIVKSLVDKQDGKIEVQSKVGEGTTFFVYLPYEAD